MGRTSAPAPVGLARNVDGAVLELQAPDTHVQHATRARLDQALGARRPPLGAVAVAEGRGA